jgi:hypothetical protein
MLKMPLAQSNSSGAAGLVERFRYLIDLFQMRWRGRGHFDVQPTLDRIREYTIIAAKHGIKLEEAQILEIGFGQRPYLGITFYGMGFDYRGIDLDLPIFPPSLLKFFRLYRANGLLRLFKTLVRFYLFDRAEYNALLNFFGLDVRSVAQAKLFVQANAAQISIGQLFLDAQSLMVLPPPLVVVSESVFEHIPYYDLVKILQNLKLFSDSSSRPLLVLTRPTIWTGICGSHLTEWYHHNVNSSTTKRSQPWEHLRLNRFVADTYLNKLSRSDFRNLFEDAGYVICAETIEHPNLGASYLEDPSLRQELAGWADEELLSNEVMFELVPKPSE